MGKNKLKKFSEMQTFSCVFQYPFYRLQEQEFPLRGRWHQEYFHNSNPIVLELGCGKGEYTVGLAEQFPDKNFIGIDIKGARIWTGAKQATLAQMPNVAFVRTSIELLTRFFAPGEVAEIWITFPDPQMAKVRKRLTSSRFIDLYRTVAAPGATVHLKSDSPFLYTFTRELALLNNLDIVTDTPDLYNTSLEANDTVDTQILGIRTFYERQWLARGLTIKYLSFRLPEAGVAIADPEVEIPKDTYRSFSRGVLETDPQFS